MNIRELQNKLAGVVPESKLYDTMTVISHWVKKLHEEQVYKTSSEKDMEALANLGTLGIAEISGSRDSIQAKLTEAGRKLYRDFTARSYYS
ncbi:MAG: hypothetical protein HYT72_04620 [Candidatus Aenigmarchaeota archaeon]|nr:hypothetical protein [Candidatus Aenigmarchaeota archaeon]